MKKITLLFLLMSILAFGQKLKRPAMGFYFSPEVSAGFNLSNIIKSNRDKETDPNYIYNNNYPNDFSYGVSAVAGYNFIPNLALGGGLKYTYTADNFHTFYAVIQPKILFNLDDDPYFVDLTYGFQLNDSAVNNADFWGVKAGTLLSFSKRLSQQAGFYLEGQQLGNTGVVFVGAFYGITLFSNKNYNKYGKDTD
ncbi:hypothetical protein [Kaistella palustris]|uniref:hypothetical protein n=1 Tax=Kaistella palustris TaxID=493376 RepID=UPI000410174D|nr:hypothetical protein [Kaistella palustris]